MLYQVPTYYYPDGYGIEDVNCIDLSIAHALGVYNKQLYYDYCAYLSINNIFCDENAFNSEKALSYLGYDKISFYEYSKGLSVIETIKQFLQQGNPILLYTNCGCLYYSDAYKVPGANNHVIMITGFDDEKDIVHIQDFEVVERYELQFTKGQIYYKNRLKVSMLNDIIESTIKFFNIDYKTFLQQKIYVVKPSKGTNITHSMRLDICQYLVNNCNNKLRLFSISEYYSLLTNEDEINRYFYYVRRPYLGGIRVVTRYAENYYGDYDSLKVHADNFIKSIDLFLSLSHREYLKNKKYFYSRLEDAIDAVVNAQKSYSSVLIDLNSLITD